MKKCNLDLTEYLSSLPALKGKTICVAFSGGADSVCLLSLLNLYKESFGFSLIASHVNHNIRGEEAKRDALFCEEFCKERDIKFTLIEVDVPNMARKGESLEEAARRLRYNALSSLEFDFLATAHHLNDNAETILLNLLRGTGIKGLCGIPKSRDNIIRPLLDYSKEEILNYCKENDLDFVVDSTNFENCCKRNILRNKVLPVFKDLNPSFLSVLKRTVSLLKRDEDYLDITAKNCFESVLEANGLKISAIYELHEAILSRVIIKYCEKELGISPDAYHIEKFIDIIKGKISGFELSCGHKATNKNGYFCFEKQSNREFFVNCYTTTAENYQKLLKINNLLLKNAVDYDKIIGKFCIRNKLPGDRLRPLNRKVTKEIRRLQQEANIDKNLRNKMPVAADENGAFWCYKVGTDERVRIDLNSKRILIFEVFEN